MIQSPANSFNYSLLYIGEERKRERDLASESEGFVLEEIKCSTQKEEEER